LYLCRREEFKTFATQKPQKFMLKPLEESVTDAAGLKKALDI
jgi:hypothetical protein